MLLDDIRSGLQGYSAHPVPVSRLPSARQTVYQRGRLPTKRCRQSGRTVPVHSVMEGAWANQWILGSMSGRNKASALVAALTRRARPRSPFPRSCSLIASFPVFLHRLHPTLAIRRSRLPYRAPALTPFNTAFFRFLASLACSKSIFPPVSQHLARTPSAQS